MTCPPTARSTVRVRLARDCDVRLPRKTFRAEQAERISERLGVVAISITWTTGTSFQTV